MSVSGDIHVTGRVHNTALLRRIADLELEVSQIRDKLAVRLAGPPATRVDPLQRVTLGG